MTELQQKQLAFLEDTAAFYNSGNRCLDEHGSCMYYLEGKAGCAIGRHVPDKDLCRKWDAKSDLGTGVTDDSIFDALPENLHELGQDFLNRVQDLHDSDSNWDCDGLSAIGVDQVIAIKQRFQLQ
jgi:hypothetical protein